MSIGKKGHGECGTKSQVWGGNMAAHKRRIGTLFDGHCIRSLYLEFFIECIETNWCKYCHCVQVSKDNEDTATKQK